MWGRFFFSQKAISEWNSLSEEFVNSGSVDEFMNKTEPLFHKDQSNTISRGRLPSQLSTTLYHSVTGSGEKSPCMSYRKKKNQNSSQKLQLSLKNTRTKPCAWLSIVPALISIAREFFGAALLLHVWFLMRIGCFSVFFIIIRQVVLWRDGK